MYAFWYQIKDGFWNTLVKIGPTEQNDVKMGKRIPDHFVVVSNVAKSWVN